MEEIISYLKEGFMLRAGRTEHLTFLRIHFQPPDIH